MLFLSSADFFQNDLFRKILSGIQSECQSDWIQVRPNILSGLIWFQTVCKGYQQTTLGGKELKVVLQCVVHTNRVGMFNLCVIMYHRMSKYT